MPKADVKKQEKQAAAPTGSPKKKENKPGEQKSKITPVEIILKELRTIKGVVVTTAKIKSGGLDKDGVSIKLSELIVNGADLENILKVRRNGTRVRLVLIPTEIQKAIPFKKKTDKPAAKPKGSKAKKKKEPSTAEEKKSLKDKAKELGGKKEKK